MSIDTVSVPASAAAIRQQVQELTSRFRSRVPITESDRNIPRESIDDLRAAGLARMLVPAEHGGLDLRIRDAVDTTVAVAKGCASTGWVSWLMMHDPHVIAMFPLEAQVAVWADGPDVVTAGSHMGMKVEKVSSGYRISGRAPFTSGVLNADWIYVGGLEPAPGGPPQPRYFLLRKDQYTVQDTWDTVGMRGTGSNTVVVDDLFVPETFSMSHVDAREGTGPGAKVNSNPALRLPWVATGGLGFVATMVGSAQAAYDDVVDSLISKKSPNGARVADSEDLQVDVGLVSAKLDAAYSMLMALADRADAGGDFTLLERSKLARTGTFIAGLAVESVDRILDLSGTSGFGTTAIVQQSWRDVHFAAAHVSINKRGTYGRTGRMILRVDELAPGMFF